MLDNDKNILIARGAIYKNPSYISMDRQLMLWIRPMKK